MDCKHCHRACDITTIYPIDTLRYCPYCQGSQLVPPPRAVPPPPRAVIHLPVDTPVTDFLSIKDKFLEKNLPRISGYLKSAMNNYMHNKMIENAVFYYKIKNEFGFAHDRAGRVIVMSEVKDILIKMYNRYFNAYRENMIPASRI